VDGRAVGLDGFSIVPVPSPVPGRAEYTSAGNVA
jgi:hypothetical protein